MKKISSVILLTAFIVFINCKSNAGEVSNTNDPEKEFYQSIIKLGNGFLDVFTSFGGLVADAFGLKADPKKSEVQKYFTSIATKLETTISSLASLPKGNGEGTTGKTGNDTANDAGNAVDSAIKEISEMLKAIADAAKEAAKAASGGDNTSIGNVVSDAAAAGAADASSVQGIAKGMKAIVDAAEATAGKAAGSKEEKKELLKAASDTGTDNANAGHLFSGTNGQGASDAQAQKAAGAINAVSGEQILKEIVDAAEKSGDGDGAGAGAANNPISAAIGAAQGDGGAFTAGGGMNQNSKVAAAIVLRGMAKDGKFAVDAHHANHKDGVKSAVEGDC
ncbi:hypothetical protein A7X70_05540 (plasmid) [Borreliella mayonii]|nr:hypothetical protein A7X70_05540 [Borreliella mayonii]